MTKYNMEITDEFDDVGCKRIEAIIRDTGIYIYKKNTAIKITCTVNDNCWTVNIIMHCEGENEIDIKQEAVLFCSISQGNHIITQFEQMDGIDIGITDFYVCKDFNYKNGIGTILWETMMNNVIDLYCSRNKIVTTPNIFISGWLSDKDYKEHHWEFSFPFYITIGSKMLNKYPQYHLAETIFARNEGNYTPMRITPIYDTGLVDCTHSLSREETDNLSKQLIEKMGPDCSITFYYIIFCFVCNS